MTVEGNARMPGHLVRRAGDAVLDAIYPRRCAGCGRRGGWVCAACEADLPRFAPPWCLRCGLPGNRHPCPCNVFSPELGVVRSAAAFDGWLRRAIHAFKYHDEWARADHLGGLLSEVLAEVGHVDGLVPVPLHPSRLRRRGYNQTALLAERAGAALGIPIVPALTRTRRTAQQVGLGGAERQANVGGAFVADASRARDRRLVLIDDVITTGSTIGACAAALAEGGASEIMAVSLARET